MAGRLKAELANYIYSLNAILMLYRETAETIQTINARIKWKTKEADIKTIGWATGRKLYAV
jgi:hypothetical protein